MKAKEVLHLASNGLMYKNAAKVERGLVRFNRKLSNSHEPGSTGYEDTIESSGRELPNKGTDGISPNWPKGDFFDWLSETVAGGLNEENMHSVISNVAKYIRENGNEASKVSYLFYLILFSSNNIKALKHTLMAGILPSGSEIMFHGFNNGCITMLKTITQYPATQTLAWWIDFCIELLEKMEQPETLEGLERKSIYPFSVEEYNVLREKLLDFLSTKSPGGEEWSESEKMLVAKKWSPSCLLSTSEMYHEIEERWVNGQPTYSEEVEVLRLAAAQGDLLSVWKILRDRWEDPELYPETIMESACIHGHSRLFYFFHKTLGLLPRLITEKIVLEALKSGHKGIVIEIHNDRRFRNLVLFESIWKDVLKTCVTLGQWEVFDEFLLKNEDLFTPENKHFFVDLALQHVEMYKLNRFVRFMTCGPMMRNARAWSWKVFRGVVEAIFKQEHASPLNSDLIIESLVKVLRKLKKTHWANWKRDFEWFSRMALKYKKRTLVKKLLSYRDFAGERRVLMSVQKNKHNNKKWNEMMNKFKSDREKIIQMTNQNRMSEEEEDSD